ncbi:photosystem II repair protein Psb32 [Limnospira platensis CENA597]|uniref:photosystem II repair protein Psb32 n=1 Tax=Limnospira platensis TaxID=118562 RepID=UPI003D6E2563
MNQQLNVMSKWWHLLAGMIAIVMVLLLSTAPAMATGVYQMPDLKTGDRTWIIDDEDILSRATEGRINQSLEKLADQTGYEVRLVTIRRLDYGETAQSFTDQLFEKWFPTAEEATNQTLLMVDTQTNNSAIHTGDNVKPLLSGAIADSVANETLQVPLREGEKYNEAFLAATDRIVKVLSGQGDPGAPKLLENLQVASTFKSAEETDDKSATILVVVVLVIATVAPMATYYYLQRP